MLFKKQADILLDLIDYTSNVTNKITDFNVGSAIRAIYDAISIESENLYMLTLENISEGIEQGLMQSFDFTVREATFAYGDIAVEFSSPATVNTILPKGTSFSMGDSSSSLRFTTRDNYTIPQGETSILVTAYANTPGIAGNVAANDITTAETNIYNVSRVYNPDDILTGAEEESYQDTKKRFQLFIESIGRATKNAIKYGALTVPNISSVFVYEQVGLVTVYAADANGNLSDEDISNLEDVLEDYRPAGIQLVVSPMVKKRVDVDLELVLETGVLYPEKVSALVKKTVSDYLNAMEADQDLILSKLVNDIVNTSDAIKDIHITDPDENLLVDPDEIIRAGTITITLQDEVTYVGI